MARKFNGREVFVQPSVFTAKNGVGTGPVPLGHFRERTLEIGKEDNTRPELPASRQKDGRKGS